MSDITRLPEGWSVVREHDQRVLVVHDAGDGDVHVCATARTSYDAQRLAWFLSADVVTREAFVRALTYDAESTPIPHVVEEEG